MSNYNNYLQYLDQDIAKMGLDFSSQEFFELQRTQVMDLIQYERDFVDELIALQLADTAYGVFVDFITKEKCNILAARPYFRERQTKFSSEITGHLQQRNLTALSTYRINHPMLSFWLKRLKVTPQNLPSLWAIYQKVESQRMVIARTNAPLALNRCKKFWNTTPHSHLEYMDLIQIAQEGLLTAIDKFVPPFTKVFRSVIIGRITAGHIKEYSSTMVHFLPDDRRIIYKANKCRKDGLSAAATADRINQEIGENCALTESDVQDIMSASSHLSLFGKSDDTEEGAPSLIDVTPSATTVQPDAVSEKMDVYRKMTRALHCLPMFEQKLLRAHFGI
jgi:DNA-directed RNA polymerase specialized sigma subunit